MKQRDYFLADLVEEHLPLDLEGFKHIQDFHPVV